MYIYIYIYISCDIFVNQDAGESPEVAPQAAALLGRNVTEAIKPGPQGNFHHENVINTWGNMGKYGKIWEITWENLGKSGK